MRLPKRSVLVRLSTKTHEVIRGLGSYRRRYMALFLIPLAFASVAIPSADQVIRAIEAAKPIAQKEKEMLARANARRNSDREVIVKDDKFKTADVYKTDDLSPVSESVKREALKSQETPAFTKGSLGNEKAGLRTSNSQTFENSDGGEVTVSAPTPLTYEDKNGRLQPISDRLSTVKSNPTNISGLPEIEVKNASDEVYRGENGSIKATFSPLKDGGVIINYNDHEIKIAPDTKASSKPFKTANKDSDTVTYKNVWPDVDLSYDYKGVEIKENIILNQKPQSNKFVFNVSGAKVEQNPENDKTLLITGDFDGKLLFNELNVNVNKIGNLDYPPVKQYPANNGSQVVVELDQAWLDGLKSDAYPVVIDPPITDANGITGGATGQFTAYKSDGYVCSSSVCDVNAGGLTDGGTTKHWRTVMRIPYSQVVGRQLLAADLYLPMRTGTGYWGTYSNKTVYVSWASCNGYSCVGTGPQKSAVIGSSGAIDVTSLIAWMRDNAGTGGSLIVWGENNNSSFKVFNPSDIRLYLYTNQYPTQPTPQLPSTSTSVQATVTTTEPQLKVSKSTDANGDTVNYQFVVKANNGNVVWASGSSPSRQVIIPEGILQDGSSYKWEYQYSDAYWISSVINGGSFKVDLQTGKDKSHSYDDYGPLSISMNNGDLFTSMETHSISALGGDIGLTLNYSSPYLTKKGLQAQYYPNDNFANNPSYRRIEPNINQDWDLGSPVTGIIPSDDFSVRWNGFFIAPVAGNYTFGSDGDDFMSMTVDGTAVFSNNCCGLKWSATPVWLEAGQAAEIYIWHADYGGAASANLMVKGVVAQQVVPTDWLRTQAVPTQETGGLTGHYYYDNGTHNTANLTKFLERNDPSVNFDWSTGAPVPGAPSDNFFAHWEGYFTAPINGTYKFGVGADDWAKVTVNGVDRATITTPGAYTTNYDGTGFTLTAGQTVPISVDYYEGVGSSKVKLLLNGPLGVGDIDPRYLTHNSNVLPTGWTISAGSGGLLGYQRLAMTQNGDVQAFDGSGVKWLFTNTGSGYKPPTNSDAILTRNSDGTHTLTESDGWHYIFNLNGTLQSASAPQDDRNPASLRYEYVTQNGIPKLKKIIDGVDSSRFGTLYYQGDTGCHQPYEGLDPAPPSGMLCGFETTDGRFTDFMYSDGKMVVVRGPGYADSSFSYYGNGTLAGYRDVLTEDAVWAGQRPNDSDSYTWIWYDALGRSTGFETQKPTPTSAKIMHYIQFLPNATKQILVDASQPNGYSRYIEYDNLLRTTKDCDILAKCTIYEYDPNKDLNLSVTDPNGLKTTTIYNDEDLPIQSYGPAPSAWFGSNRLPLSTYTAQIPKSEVGYDENITGGAVAYYNYEGNLTPSGKLFDSPKLHTTGINTSSPAVMQKTWSSAPITVDSGREGFGVSITGKLRLPSAGTYQIKAAHDDGVRIWVDDVLVGNDWVNGVYRDTIGSFTHTAGQVHRLKIDYYNVSGTPTNDATLNISLQQSGGFTWTNNWASYLKPGYGLETSATIYDTQLGNSSVQTTYQDPAYGLLQNTTVDSTGLNYQSSATNEAAGTGYFRQLSRTSPGGSSTQYSYYGSTETVDNPCTSTTEAYKQAGFIKGRIDQDPDGSGSATSLTTQTIYNDAGDEVASRIGDDDWSCTWYDDRGRVSYVYVPTMGARAGREISYNYYNGGNPLSTKVTDDSGDIVTTVDLLGRRVSYIDVWGNVTNTSYDAFGKPTQRTSPLGTETYIYDTYNRLESYKNNGQELTKLTYDSNGKVQKIEYPTIVDGSTSQKLTLNQPQLDSLGRVTGIDYTLPSGSHITNTLSLSQSGTVLDETVNGADLSGSSQNAYSYDKAGRLTTANVAGHTYSYGFGATNSACASKTGNNTNAGKNSNRTSMTVDGASTWYCYDMADRLIGSSDGLVDSPTYDSHGNTLSLGSASATTFKYDQSDRNVEIQEGTDKKVTYERDVSDRVVKRQTLSGSTNTTYYYGHTGGANATFMYTDNTTKQVLEQYLTLPGGVVLTVRPTASTSADKSTASIRNIRGDVLSVINGDGVNQTGILLYDPFGQRISATSAFASTNSSVSFATAVVSLNNAGDSLSSGWAGSARRSGEDIFTLKPIQMGARVYIPGLGRFLSVDSVEGGSPNNYAYTQNPINENDYSGQFVQVLALVGLGAGFTAALPVVIFVGSAILVGAAIYHIASQASHQSADTGSKPSGGKNGSTPNSGSGGGGSAPRGGGGSSGGGGSQPPKGSRSAPPVVIAGYKITQHALERMKGSRGDVGMTKWSIETVIKHGKNVPAHSGRTAREIPGLGKVILQADEIVTAMPRGGVGGADFQGWFVQMLIKLLLG